MATKKTATAADTDDLLGGTPTAVDDLLGGEPGDKPAKPAKAKAKAAAAKPAAKAVKAAAPAAVKPAKKAVTSGAAKAAVAEKPAKPAKVAKVPKATNGAAAGPKSAKGQGKFYTAPDEMAALVKKAGTFKKPVTTREAAEKLETPTWRARLALAALAAAGSGSLSKVGPTLTYTPGG